MLAYARQIKILLFSLFNVDFKRPLNVETAFTLEAFRWQMSSTVVLIYAVDVRSRLIWLANIWHFYYIIQKLSNLWSCCKSYL